MSKKKEIQGRKGGKKKDIDRLRGRKCTKKCKMHGEPCGVVMRYKDPQIQATLDRLNALAGVPRHEDSVRAQVARNAIFRLPARLVRVEKG